jgi:hypothetical protein
VCLYVQAEAGMQMEVMLGRLREVEGEKQQLEARGSLLASENNDLADQVGHGVEKAGVHAITMNE